MATPVSCQRFLPEKGMSRRAHRLNHWWSPPLHQA